MTDALKMPEFLVKIKPDTTLPDGVARWQAIHPQQSFIVQAPAGSGKTALLTQRFLALLAVVDKPEQVVAMTFTKKAAAEMRERIFDALKASLTQINPNSAPLSLFEQNARFLSQAALKQDAEKGWQLLKNPNRLRIRTIDSMNGYLVQQMPFLSRLGSQPKMATANDELYRKAVREVFKNPMVEGAVAELLRLVNGRYLKAENLLVMMLQKRDQWMKHLTAVAEDDGRDFLEDSLNNLVEQEKRQAIQLLGNRFEALNEIASLAENAVLNGYAPAQPLVGVTFSVGQTSTETPTEAWQALGQWLLTSTNDLRKSANKNIGFPPEKGAEKNHKQSFLDALSECRAMANFDDFERGLKALKSLPEPRYSEEEWQSLSRLISLLKLSVGHLKLVFQQAGEADFIEVAQAASQALGTETEPTDLAERLDYQLKHLLIDEFQDTSVGQFDLVKKLTATWTEDDGRSLFIVGDPMQSIYRFREAEVGNFLTAWQGSLGAIKIKPLNLTVNFRSKKGVVDWVNTHFKSALPPKDDIEKGAVSYTPSETLSTDSAEGIITCWALNQSNQEQTEKVLEEIQKIRSQPGFMRPDLAEQGQASQSSFKTIGILGRSRSHLTPIAMALKTAGIPFRAVELEALGERQEIQDALALTRALLHLGDRPAWVALLRSPLVGLSLSQLYELLGQNDDYFSLSALSSIEQSDLTQMPAIQVLQDAIVEQGRLSFSRLVRETWLKLDGAQTLYEPVALDNMEAFWTLLESLPRERLNAKGLDQALAQLYAQPDSSEHSAQIELMTMHKSKGLEFSFVFLPGLGKLPRNDDQALVSWLSYTRSNQSEGLVLAPIARRGKDTSALTNLIKRFELEKQTYEWARLLYVAVTRAKEQCYLFGSVKYKDDEEDLLLKVPEKSLLACLWPSVKEKFYALVDDYSAPEATDEIENITPKVSRLSENRPTFKSYFLQADLSNEWQNEVNQETNSAEILENAEKLTANTQGLFNTAIGNLFHAILEQAAHQPDEMWQWSVFESRWPIYEAWLLQVGLLKAQLPEAMARLKVSLQNASNNPKVGWCLSSAFASSAAEKPLSHLDEGGAHHFIVDRTLVDEQGVRWIIDYKTSFFDASGALSQSAFIEKQVATYRTQLEGYGDLFEAIEDRPQKHVLYFSYIDAWIEVN